MTINERYGFDVVGTRIRLEDWCLEHFAFPLLGGLPQWPGGRRDGVQLLLDQHWGEHGVHRVTRNESGELGSAPRCQDDPCRVLGVALALREVDAHQAVLAELDEIDWLRAAEQRFSISESTRAEFLDYADYLEATRISRAIKRQTSGRPKLTLAQGMSQQLKRYGFSQREIGLFMGATVAATRERLKVEDVRTLGALVGLEGSA